MSRPVTQGVELAGKRFRYCACVDSLRDFSAAHWVLEPRILSYSYSAVILTPVL